MADSNSFTDLAQILGQASAARGQGNLQEGVFGLSQDQLKNNQWNSVLDAMLRQQAMNQTQQTLNQQRPGILAKQAVQGDFLANAQDAGVTGLPNGVPKIQFTGGLRPSMLSPGTRQLGATMAQNALTGTQSPAPNFQMPLPAPPTLTTPPQQGTLEKLLGGGSLLTGILGALTKSSGGGGGQGASAGGGPSAGNINIPDMIAALRNRGTTPEWRNTPGQASNGTIPGDVSDFGAQFGQGANAGGVDPALLAQLMGIEQGGGQFGGVAGDPYDPMNPEYDWGAGGG